MQVNEAPITPIYRPGLPLRALGLPLHRDADLHADEAMAVPRIPAPIGGLLRQVLDAISLGLILVDREGRLVHANQAAGPACSPGEPMAAWAERLGLRLGSDDAQPLASALADACRGRWSMVMAQRAGLTVSIGVAPLDSDPTCPGVAAMLVVTGSEACTSLPLQFFCQQHKLTPTEALVLSALHDGQAPGQIADGGRVAMTTVRTHIATIRAKVRAPSIRHLMRMLAALPPLMGAVARRGP